MEEEPVLRDPTPVPLYSESEGYTDSSEEGEERRMSVTDRAKSYVERRVSEDRELEERKRWAPLPDTPTPEPILLYDTEEEEEYREKMRSQTPTKPPRSTPVSREGVTITMVSPAEESTDSSSDVEVVRRMSVSDRALRYVQKREEEVAAAQLLETAEPLPDPLRKKPSVELFTLEDETSTRDTYTDPNLTTEDQGFGSISMERQASRDEEGRELDEYEEENGDESGIVHSSDSSHSAGSPESSIGFQNSLL